MKKDINEIKEKLRKLFAMMEDGNGACQSEVESAMKIARKLMAEYKLSDNDVREVKGDAVLTIKLEGIEFSTMVNPWVLSLLNIVADNYCCHPVVYTAPRARTKTAGLIGFEDDVEIAKTVLKYAYECILSGYKAAEKAEVRRARMNAYYSFSSMKEMTAAERTSARNAYGNGYVRGIQEAFEEQNRVEVETGFAMVMVEPQEVKDVANGMKKSSFNSSNATRKARNYDNYAANGYLTGKEFNINRRIA